MCIRDRAYVVQSGETSHKFMCYAQSTLAKPNSSACIELLSLDICLRMFVRGDIFICDLPLNVELAELGVNHY